MNLRTIEMGGIILFGVLIAGMFGNGCIEDPALWPEAAFVGSPRSGYAPLQVNFADRSQPGGSLIQTWDWRFGDGTTGTKRHPNHVYQEPGMYNVGLTVRNAHGKSSVTRREYILVYEPVLQLQRDFYNGVDEYTPGETIGVTLQLTANQAIELSALGIRETLPAGWEVTHYSSDSEVDAVHTPSDSSTIEILWHTPPSLPLEIKYVAQAPENAFGQQAFDGEAFFRAEAEELRSNIAHSMLTESN